MKNLSKSLLLLFLLTASFGFSQIKKLGELSSHKFMNSRPIFEDNSDDIWGYALLYMSDVKSSYIGEFELVLIDKNLNKVGSVVYDDVIIHYKLVKSYPKIAYANKKGDDLLLSIQIYDESLLYTSTWLYSYFRNLDLNTFKMSDCFVITEDGKSYLDLSTLENSKIKKELGRFQRFGRNYFVRHEFGRVMLNPESRTLKYSIYDRAFNKGFEYELPKKLTPSDRFSILAQTPNFVIIENDIHGKFSNYPSTIYEVYDRKTNEKINDVSYFKKSEWGFPILAKEEEGKLVIFEQAHLAYFTRDEAKTFIGINKLTVDPSHPKDVKVEEFRIKSVGNKIQTNSKGGLSNEGKLSIIDYRITSENDIILVAGFFVGESRQLSNMYIFEFDKNFNSKNVINLKEEYSTKNIQVNLFSKMNKSMYLYSQKVSEDHFVFFYFDNEKRGKKVNLSNESHYSLHVLSYEKGNFNTQKIEMKTNYSELYPMIAKLGFVVFHEIGNEKSEIRLERLNF